MSAQQFSPQSARPKAPAELTPRDDLKKQVSEVLKRVDQLIKKGDLDLAQREVAHAKQLDPRNVYALAFEERIENLQNQETEGRLAAEAKQHAEEEALRKSEEERLKAEETRNRIRAEAAAVLPKPQPAPVNRDEIIQGLKQEELKRQQAAALAAEDAPVVRTITPAPAAPAPAPVPPAPQVAPQESHDDEIRIFREFLDQIWENGMPSGDERRQVEQLQPALGISGEELSRMENDSRLRAYYTALRKAITSAHDVGGGTTTLKQLRTAFNISNEEHTRVETKLMSDIQRTKRRPTVLIIDDDSRLLQLLAQAIEDAGFETIALETSDEAFALMRKLRPDLILCDINLETSTMGGFTFYEKVQERPHLQDVPFIFLTGLTDEVLVRAGKELGVDDYLLKPISEETLVSTLRGKLKRFRQLRTVLPKRAAAAAVAA